ncbi:MAG TPA: glycosyltransferase family 9 protein [Candidatus Kryptonia bacterium]
MRILVSRLQFIGDIILTTPVLEVLRERFPNSQIDYLGEKHAVTLLEKNRDINDIIQYDFDRPSILEQIRVSSLLRARKYDVAIDLFGNPRSAVVIYLSGATMRIGGSFGWRKNLFTHPIVITERINAVSFHLRYLQPLGINESFRPPKITITEDEIRSVQESLGKIGGRVVGLHIGATWPAKVWPSRSFARLAEMVFERLDARVIVTYGPKDSKYISAFSSAVKIPFTPWPPAPLRQLAALISSCDVFVSNDAAPMHLSAAVGTPTVGIFGPGEPDIWFPYSESIGHKSFHKNVECCHRDFCSLKDKEFMRCMNAVQPEEVFHHIESVLSSRGRNRK